MGLMNLGWDSTSSLRLSIATIPDYWSNLTSSMHFEIKILSTPAKLLSIFSSVIEDKNTVRVLKAATLT